ncbi:uncharacterized protein LOC129909274 [Episyrphus balteatus]|uniref:uncharacterized protein LOC129909274 n=1 Tax=Episyrphus balteatus TaxID=286459 RepID=UPI002485C03C|nr:uncharacterized protein LOC129909274 [Episyrphus balteatus]
MDTELPVLAGFLNVPTQSGFSLNRISKKKSCQRYCLLFKASRHGIERLEICESKDDKNPKIITLENCVKITQEPAPANLIHIVKMTGTLTLNTLTDEDLKEWLNALQSVAFRDKGGTLSRSTAIEEDNDLYCSSYGDGLFIVKLIPSETSIRCNIEPKSYMLHLTATELQLKSAEDLSNIIAKWPYRFIRKYGYRDGKFTFEAGRKCNTGEGVFTLDHTNPQEVFRCMSSKMKSMKKLISGESLNSIDCGENQLSAALSMEPGSRSPLPPSPQNPNGCEFELNSTHSVISMRNFLPSSDSLNNTSFNSSTSSTQNVITNSSTKSIPNKPPRKLLPLNADKPQTSQQSSAPSTPSSLSLQSNELKTMINNAQQQQQQQNCDKFKVFQNYEPVSITTSNDPNRTGGSTVILKPSSSPDLLKSIASVSSSPPDLPVRNESVQLLKTTERDYESIETITDAWKTLGLGEVKHTERNHTSEDDLIDFAWQRTQSQRHKNTSKDTCTKIIDIDDSEPEAAYDRLDFLLPNNNTSSGYKTIVTVSSASNRKPASIPVPNDYELIGSPDTHPCRIADDSYLGYGVLRKPSTPGPQVANTSQSKMVNVSTTMLNDTEMALDHKNYNGLSYTIVSKPKRV